MKVLALFYFALIAKLCSASCCCGSENGEALDISDPDSSKVSIWEETSYGVKWKVFTPKSTVTFTSFTEGGAEIGKISSLCTPEKCYEKVDGKWKEIGLNDFYMRTNEIKNAVKPNEEAVNAEGTSDNLEDAVKP
ncbi:signal peptide containing protein [Theileria equi strain WA]|uniref:Signal peptide containing protein n=1 Tax=Theileria equi strain WA TaxID=1537102 RepID=L1LDW2_THEEQ|nr:signal peptide containing protein [Theileria equi strain WA]EKX73333.1 signal peptide containing protein [Theileria equi strain WA]|eukprot:XP_004832785.1 signal peptide containing protein [Theileria equi strain WA]